MKLKVVVDAGGGAASLATSQLLERMGCQVMALNCQPTGLFPRPSEPTPESLGELMAAVRETGADLGLAHDGDGDRLVAVDGRGLFIPGDKLLVLLARHLGVKRLVTTVDASMALEEQGFGVVRTRVGDAFVSEELRRGGDFGGEPCGAWIFPRVSFCPDGVYAAAVLAHVASLQPLAEMVDSLPAYPILRGSLPWANQTVDGLQDKLMGLKPHSISTVDGVRLDWEDGWLLVRASGTEPRIRLTAEARSQKRAQELYNWGQQAIMAGTGRGV